MNAPLSIAALLCIVAAAAHAAVGERWIFRNGGPASLPATRFGDGAVTRRIMRVVWHLVTIDFAGSAAVLGMVAAGGAPAAGAALARVVALHFGAYAIVGTMLGVSRIEGLLRAPQLFLFVAIAVLAWYGAE